MTGLKDRLITQDLNIPSAIGIQVGDMNNNNMNINYKQLINAAVYTALSLIEHTIG